MTGKKIRGIYLRGKIYWFTHGWGKRRLQVSLETSDYAEAVKRAQAILDNPLLNSTDGFKAELDKFADDQVKHGIWTKNSRKTKYSVLFMFGEELGFTPLLNIKTAQIQKWYDLQVKRIKVVSVNGYMTTIKSFFNWAIEKRKMFRNPADDVKLNETSGAAREQFCTFEERDEIILKAPTLNLQFVLYCGFFAGFRKNEIIEPRPDWFDTSLKHVHVKKTETFDAKDKEERTIPMADEFSKFLKKYGKKEPFMLCAPGLAGKKF